MANTQLTSSSSDFLYVDDLYFSTLIEDDENSEQKKEEDENQVFLQSLDAKYAEGLQLQEAIVASMESTTTKATQQQQKLPECPSSISHPLYDPEPVVKTVILDLEVGEPSKSCFCELCAERKEEDEMYGMGGTTTTCCHSFCTDCISKHVATKIQTSTTTMVTCPGLNCRAPLELDSCRPIIPKEVVDKWEQAMVESMIPASQRFHCPYRDCSAMLVQEESCNNEVIMEAECPICHRLFCAHCCVPWHSGVECEEYQRLTEDERGREDLMVRELATEKSWRRCPQCLFYVEKTQGCLHITCRCRFEFCYGCGSSWGANHDGNCPRN